MTLVHKNDAAWFLTLDETHHEMTTAGKKGSASSGRWVNGSFPRSGERNVVGNFHTTGVYGTTLAGEALPPLYILSTSSQNEDDYKVDPRVCEGLPIVTGYYGGTKRMSYSSCVSVRKKGSMDTGLWHQYIRAIIIPLFKGRIALTPVRDPVTLRLIAGPLIVKSDGGPGRLSRESSSIEFRDEMAQIGVHIVLSLPNGTACTAEMDQLFEKFKPACSKQARRICAKKMHERHMARKVREGGLKTTGLDDKDSDDSSADGDIDDDDDEGGGAGKKKSKKTKPKTKKGQRSLCNVSFSNYDLGHLVNGWPDDPIEDRPFDFHFSKQSIIRSHIAVGFMPMTGRAAKDPKVWFEFGPDGAPPADTARMDLLKAEYKEAGEAVTKLGYHGDMLDVVPREAEAAEIPSDEEAQIEHIVRNKLINKPGGLFRTGLIVANWRVVMESSKQVVREAGELIEVAAAKKVANNKTMEDEGVLAYQAWVESGRPKTDEGWPKMHLKPAKSIIKVLLPMIDIKGELKMKNFDRVGVCLKWLGEIARGMTWDQHMREYMMIVWEERATEGHTFDLPAPPLFEVGGV